MTTYVEGVTAIIHSFDFCIPRDRIVLFSLVLRSKSRKTTFPFFPHRRALFRRRGRGRTGGGFVAFISHWLPRRRGGSPRKKKAFFRSNKLGVQESSHARGERGEKGLTFRLTEAKTLHFAIPRKYRVKVRTSMCKVLEIYVFGSSPMIRRRCF